MTPSDEYDPDDNFAHGFDTGADPDTDDEAGTEAVVWQLVLLINPGDEEAALQQFAAFQEAWAGAGADEGEVAMILQDVIDWRAGFQVGEDDAAGLVDSLAELAARWNLRIDWGVEDPTDDEFLGRAEVEALLATAFDRLREHGYTLWMRETDDGYAGWISLSRDDEAMRVLAPALGIDVRPAGV
jgi:hypothetical protein